MQPSIKIKKALMKLKIIAHEVNVIFQMADKKTGKVNLASEKEKESWYGIRKTLAFYLLALWWWTNVLITLPLSFLHDNNYILNTQDLMFLKELNKLINVKFLERNLARQM